VISWQNHHGFLIHFSISKRSPSTNKMNRNQSLSKLGSTAVATARIKRTSRCRMSHAVDVVEKTGSSFSVWSFPRRAFENIKDDCLLFCCVNVVCFTARDNFLKSHTLSLQVCFPLNCASAVKTTERTWTTEIDTLIDWFWLALWSPSISTKQTLQLCSLFFVSLFGGMCFQPRNDPLSYIHVWLLAVLVQLNGSSTRTWRSPTFDSL